MNWTVKIYKSNPRNNTSQTFKTKREAVAAVRDAGVSEDERSGEVIVLERDGIEVARRRTNQTRISWL